MPGLCSECERHCEGNQDQATPETPCRTCGAASQGNPVTGGRLFALWRKAMGIKAMQVCKKFDIPKSSLSNWENGRASLYRYLNTLAEYSGWDAGDLIR